MKELGYVKKQLGGIWAYHKLNATNPQIVPGMTIEQARISDDKGYVQEGNSLQRLV